MTRRRLTASSARFGAVLLAGALCCVLTLAAHAESDELVCFSMREAQARTGRAGEILPEIEHLGYITDPMALVVARDSGDCIVVGRRTASLPTLYLDDLVLALAQDPEDEPPGVSLDVLVDDDGGASLLALYFGGIRNSHFGKVCFEADYLLKKMGAGRAPTGSPHVPEPSLLAMWNARRDDREQRSMRTHQYFCPSVVRVLASEDAVVLDACKMAVETVSSSEGGGAPRSGESPDVIFARALTEHYDEVSRTYPVLAELKALMSFVALAKGLSTLPIQPDLAFWLEDYEAAVVATPRFVPIEEWGEAGVVYSQLFEGGVYLRVTADRVISGDPYVYAEAVRSTKPDSSSLTWVLRIVDDTLYLPESDCEAVALDAVSLGTFMLERKRNRSAIELYDRALALDPSLTEALVGKARAFRAEDRPYQALKAYNLALQQHAGCLDAFLGRSETHETLKDSVAAMADLTAVLELAPDLREARLRRGQLLSLKGRYEEALADFDAVLEHDPNDGAALVGRSDALLGLGDSLGAAESLELAEEQRGTEGAPGRDEARGARARAARGQELFGVAGETFGSVQTVDVKEHLLRLSVRVSLGYGAARPYPFPTAGLYIDQGAYSLKLPMILSWAYRNRLRLDATFPVVLNLTLFQIPEGAGTTHTVLGIAGGVQDATLGVRHLLWDGRDGRATLLADVHVVVPTWDALFEDYVNKEEIDISGSGGYREPLIPWEDPFWKIYLGAEYGLRLSRRSRLSVSASVTHPFGIDPTERDPYWDAIEAGLNWGAGADLTVLFPGDASAVSGVQFSFKHVRTGTDYEVGPTFSPEGSGRELFRKDSRNDDVVAIAVLTGKPNSLSHFQAGVRFTTWTTHMSDLHSSSDISFFVGIGLGREWELVNRWF